MNLYNIYQWFLFFYVYCFLGWCIESTIVSVENKKIINRGFLSGPLLPIYGFGAVLVLFITLPVRNNIIAVYFIGMIGATILEYFTGWLMEIIFKVKYWDYSYYKVQYKGRICLVSSLFWGILSVLLIEIIHKPIEQFILNLNNNLTIFVSLFITILVFIDTITSVKATIDINKLMEKSEKTLNEIKDLKYELEVVLNNAVKQMDYYNDLTEGDLRDLGNRIKESVDNIKDRIENLSSGVRKEVNKFNFIKNRLVKGHPTGYSIKFNYSYRDLKERILKQHSDEKEDVEKKKNAFLKKIDEIKNNIINKNKYR